MCKRSLPYRILLFVVLVVLPVQAFAAPQITISQPGSNGVSVVQGIGFTGIHGLDLTISYDSATMSSPVVTMGGFVNGMMSASNPSNPIRINSVTTNPISGSGTIATIAFTRSGDSAGNITGILAKAITSTSNGSLVIIPAFVSAAANSTDTATTTSESGTPGSTPGGTAGGTTGLTTNVATGGSTGVNTVGGTLTFPGDSTGKDTPAKDNKDATSQPPQQESPKVAPPEPPAPSAPDSAETKPPKDVQPAPPPPKPVQAVLESFRLYQGERTVKNLSALFNREGGTNFSQYPAIAVADGKATVKLIISKVAGERAPNFAFNSARYVSLARGDEGEWEVEVRPDAGAVSASVTMLANGTLQEFPLTVTPKVEVSLIKPGKVSEADFLLFLKETGTPAAPGHDLNGDGKRDYLDDYIFTANYLLKVGEQANNKKAAQQPM